LSEDFIRTKKFRGEIQSLYTDMLRFRKHYDDHLLDINDHSREMLDETTTTLLESAARHYRIYNYYDAAEILNEAERRLKA
jgi:hypothetical protein